MHRITTPNTTTVSDHRLGAALAFLGFPCSWTATVHESTRQKHIQFFFERQSIRFTGLPDLDTLLTQWRADSLPVHHVLSVAMRAHRNYDAVLRWQKTGDTQLLRSVADARAWAYADGPLPLYDAQTVRQCDHLVLAAALAEIGFQIFRITGADRAHTYWLSAIGHRMHDSAGQFLAYDLATVTRLAPTADDPRRLALEDPQPMHPLVISYNTLRCRALIKKQIDAECARLLIEEDVRQALIHTNASGRVMDHVAAHFKAPPVANDQAER